MSITWLPREQGLVVRCDETGCTTKFHTGLIIAKNVREWLAKNEGWGRGLLASTKTRFGTKRNDYCPPHLALQRQEAATEKAEKAERKKQRDLARKAKHQPKEPKPKKPRKSKSTASAASPSADSHPAPAT